MQRIRMTYSQQAVGKSPLLPSIHTVGDMCRSLLRGPVRLINTVSLPVEMTMYLVQSTTASPNTCQACLWMVRIQLPWQAFNIAQAKHALYPLLFSTCRLMDFCRHAAHTCTASSAEMASQQSEAFEAVALCYAVLE